MKKHRVVNLFAGPGTGKSTISAALFAELKYQGYNTEMVPEYAKDASWENRGAKVFAAQEYIFGKQHFRLSRVASEVEFAITDSPVLMSLVYIPENYYMPALPTTIYQAHLNYDSINIFLTRSSLKAYNPKGRNQTAEEAAKLDVKIENVLKSHNVPYDSIEFSRDTVSLIIDKMYDRGWLKK